MNIRKVLEKNIPSNIRFDEWPRAVEQLAPIIERALRVVADEMEATYMEIYHEGSKLDEGVKAACVTAGVAAMVEEK